MNTDSFVLPPLKKKIIYLDQFVISEMMKAVNSKIGKKDKVDPFYIKLFEKLEILSRAQLIVCPDSSFHKDESLSSKYYEALRHMYEHFSDGATFYDPMTIHRFQIQERYRAFRDGKEYKFIPKPESILHARDLHGWRDSLRISVDFPVSDTEIQQARELKEKIHVSLSETFEKRWRIEKEKKFNDWYLEEAYAYGIAMNKLYLQIIEKQALFVQGDKSVSMEEIVRNLGSEAIVLYTSLMGFQNKETFKLEYDIVTEFLLSDMMLEVPFNKISALLWACIADSACRGGRTTPPNAGTPNDIEMISTFLPYCDAIFVDKLMYAVLSHGEVAKEISELPTMIFSLQKGHEFLDYLDNLLKETPSAHIDKIKEVYGENWDQPYWTMYENENY